VSLADLRPAQDPDPRLKLLADEIAELSAHLDAATARLLERIREFDARGGWNTGFRSCAEWLAWRVSLDLGAAREKVRVARALGSLPRLAAALARGELSYAKVRALTRVATPETEEQLLAVGRAGTAAHIVRGWRWMDRTAEAHDTALQHTARALHVYQDEDGTVVVRGRLAPEVGAFSWEGDNDGQRTSGRAGHSRIVGAWSVACSFTRAPAEDGVYISSEPSGRDTEMAPEPPLARDAPAC
jgi:hypothetical protein